MQIAILGATSQIARDLIRTMAGNPQLGLHLFARRPDEIKSWIQVNGIQAPVSVAAFIEFGKSDFDAILNFVGVGNPAKCLEIGNAIFDITHVFDSMVMNYLHIHPHCRYIFLSSGAVYGSDFTTPVSGSSKAEIPINDLKPENWYGAAKLAAECRHRAHPDFFIYDLRVFGYFSRSQDMDSRFLMTDIIRAIRDKKTLSVSPENVVRDYLSPHDFRHLIEVLLQSTPANVALDCYSKAPITKTDLLQAMREIFGLKYEIVESIHPVNATGLKSHYYSKNQRAADFGYQPALKSIDGIIRESSLIFGSKIS